MDYKKMYEEALERAKYLKENTDSVNAKDISYTFEYIFPELKESEDEKIRKEIIKLVHFFYCSSSVYEHHVSEEDMIAWLEKQGEKSWNEEDEKFLVDTMNFLYRAKNQYAQTARLEECIDWLKSIKPNHCKPSEELLKDLPKWKKSYNNPKLSEVVPYLGDYVLYWKGYYIRTKDLEKLPKEE